MTSSRFIVGDVFDVLASLRAEGAQVDLVLTSPPFLALRSYLPPDHPDKGKEIGSEPTPAAFLSTMLDVVEACAEVLSPTGTLVFEFGDTYAGSGGGGGDYAAEGLRAGQPVFDGSGRRVRETRREGYIANGVEPPARRDTSIGWPQDKSLCMIPELFAASLAYGRNLLDPDRTTDPWRIRNTIAWVRPNPPVGALGDKFRPAKSLITVAAKARDRWFDLDAVRYASDYDRPNLRGNGSRGPGHDVPGQKRNGSDHTVNPAGAPPLDWWKISPGGYSGSHYAVFPPELCRIPIEASCPRRVCRTCGTPSRREVEHDPDTLALNASKRGDTPCDDRSGDGDGMYQRAHFAGRNVSTTGWTTCGCPGTDGIRLDGYHTGTGWRPGIVLDPFAGSGTSLMVAHGLSRASIGIDLDARNADLARERLGMFVEITELGGRPHVA